MTWYEVFRMWAVASFGGGVLLLVFVWTGDAGDASRAFTITGPLFMLLGVALWRLGRPPGAP